MSKRQATNEDPDYESYEDTRTPSPPKITKHDADIGKTATVRRINRIIQRTFDEEIRTKQNEVFGIDKKLSEARVLMDRLRACIVTVYYKNGTVHTATQPTIHPCVKQVISTRNADSDICTRHQQDGDCCTQHAEELSRDGNPSANRIERNVVDKQEDQSPTPSLKKSSGENHTVKRSRVPRTKIKRKIIVGNVSKFLPLETRGDTETASHKWMAYVRGPRDQPGIDDIVEKVLFFLHPSYRPHDLVQVTENPFHLTRRGWGEFPLRVQLHFKDKRNKKVDIIHNLKLDKTYTGLQTLGAETVVEVELEEDVETRGNTKQHSHNTAAYPDNTPRCVEDNSVTKRASPSSTFEKVANTLAGEQSPSEPLSVDLKEEVEQHFLNEAFSESNLMEDQAEIIPAGQENARAKHLQINGANSDIVQNKAISDDQSVPVTNSGPGMRVVGTTHSSDTTQSYRTEKQSAGGQPNDVGSDRENTRLGISARDESLHCYAKKDMIFGQQYECDSEKQVDRSIKQESGENESSAQENISQEINCNIQENSSIKQERIEDGSDDKEERNNRTEAVSGKPVFVKCLDKQGRTLLVPQHIVVKSLQQSKRATSQSLVSSVVTSQGIDGLTTKAIKSQENMGNFGKLTMLRLPGSKKSANSSVHIRTPSKSSLSDRLPTQQLLSQVNAALSKSDTVTCGNTTNCLKMQDSNQANIKEVVGLRPTKPIFKRKIIQKPGVSLLKPINANISSLLGSNPQSLLKPGVARNVKVTGCGIPISPTGNVKAPDQKTGNMVSAQKPISNVCGISVEKGKTWPKLCTDSFSLTKPCNVKVVNALHTSELNNMTPVLKGESLLKRNLIPEKSNLQSAVKKTQPSSVVRSEPVFTLLKTPNLVVSSREDGFNSSNALPQSGVDQYMRKDESSPVFSKIKVSANLPSAEVSHTVKSETRLVNEKFDSQNAATDSAGPKKGIAQNLVCSNQTFNLPNCPLTPGAIQIRLSDAQIEALKKGNALQTVLGQIGAHQIMSSNLSVQSQNGPGVSSVPGLHQSKTVGVLNEIQNPFPTKLETGVNGTESNHDDLSSENVGVDSVSVMYESNVTVPAVATTVPPPLVIVPEACMTLDPKPERKIINIPKKKPVWQQYWSLIEEQKERGVLGMNEGVTDGEKPIWKILLDRQKEEQAPKRVRLPPYQLSDFSSLDDLLATVIKYFPLIEENPDRNLHPYCAPSVKQWNQWPVAKRRAHEFMRVVFFRRSLVELLHGEEFNGVALPSKQRLKKWCRHHAYTPLDDELRNCFSTGQRNVPSREVSSLSLAEDILSRSVKGSGAICPNLSGKDTQSVHIDIVNSDNESETDNYKKVVSPVKYQFRDKHYLPITEQQRFIQNTCSQIGVQLKPVEIMNEEKEVFYGSVSEQTLWKSAEKFMDCLLRKAFSSVCARNRLPDDLNIEDVYDGITTEPQCDFLSNQHLATNEQCNTETTHL